MEKNTKPTESKKSSLRDLLLEEHPKQVRLQNGVPPLKDYIPKSVGTPVKTRSEKVQTEEQVVKDCKKYLKEQGWITKTMYTGGIPTGAGGYALNPAKGVPDCIAFHLSTKRMIWIEFKKSSGGIISPEQMDWHNLLRSTGQKIYVINSKKLLEEVLNATQQSNP